MSKIRRRLCYWLYRYFAKWLPSSGWSSFPFRGSCRLLRQWLAKGMLDHAGVDITIERGASFGSGGGISVGDHSGIGLNCYMQSPVMIGNNVMMGPDVLIFTSNHRYSRLDIPMIQQGHSSPKPVRIGDDVWIGSRVIILPGAVIGSGSVIGAGSVVRGVIPEMSIALGNPAQVVGTRMMR